MSIHTISSQVTVSQPEVAVDCFDLNDFTANDLETSCSLLGDPFPSVVIALLTTDGVQGNTFQCCTGTVIVNYSGNDLCDNAFSVNKTVNIANSGLSAIIPPDVTVSCINDIILPQVSDVTVNSPCGGEVSISIDKLQNDGQIENPCMDFDVTYRYSISDQCENLEFFQTYFVQQNDIILDVGDEEIMVECTDEISVTQDDITIQLPCEAEVINLTFVEPDLTSSSSTCNNQRHTFSWFLETTCGDFSASKEFRIRNEEVKLIVPQDITISCLDHPLSDQALLSDVTIEAACPNYPESGPIQLQRPFDESLPEEFSQGETYNYTFVVTDECTGSDKFASISVSVLPEPIELTFTEEITIFSSFAQLEDRNFLLKGVNAISPCCNVTGIEFISTSSGDDILVEYIASDDCGNQTVETKIFVFEPAVSLTKDKDTIFCFSLDEFSEENLTTTCAEGFASLDITVNLTDEEDEFDEKCLSGSTFLTYSGTTNCGDTFSLIQEILIVNPGIVFEVPEDITISCSELPLSSQEIIDLVSINSSCGITIDQIFAFISDTVGNLFTCNEFQDLYNISVIDQCSNFSSTNFEITVKPEFPSITFENEVDTIRCLEDLENLDLLDGVLLQLPCSRLSGEVQIGEPEIMAEVEGSCDGTVVQVNYEIVDQCGNSAFAERTFITSNPDFRIEIAEDVTVDCIEAISVSPNDVSVNNSCGTFNISVDFDVQQALLENSGCPGEVITIEYIIEVSCGTLITISRNFTIGNPPLLPIVFSEEFIDGATLTFSCGEEEEMDAILNAGTIVFESFVCDYESEAKLQPYLVPEFEKIELQSENCDNDGIIKRFQFTWTVEDDCGRTGNFTLFANLTDGEAPVITGVPDNITIACNLAIPDIENVVAEDDCGISDLDIKETVQLAENSGIKQKIITRIWTATDLCGNITSDFQTITVIDADAPRLSFIKSDGDEISNGATLFFECGEDLRWLDDLDNDDIKAEDNCGCAHSEFTLLTAKNDKENTPKLKEVLTPTWTVYDEFGNVSVFAFNVKILDTKPPTFTGSDTLFICENNIEGFIFLEDECGNASSTFNDIKFGQGIPEIFIRRHLMTDEENNYTSKDQVVVDFSNRPKLIELREDFDISDQLFSCSNENARITPFSTLDVKSRFEGFVSLDIIFEENPIPNVTKDSLLSVELNWIATTPCGYADTIKRVIDVIDTIPPTFESFQTTITVECISEVEKLVAIDACGLQSLIYNETVLEEGCGFSKKLLRTYEAVDASGNQNSASQTILVIDTIAPVFEVESKVYASDYSSFIYATDPCSNEKIEALVVSESILYECDGYRISTQTLSATDDCGNTTLFEQEIYDDDYPMNFIIVDPKLEALLALPSLEISSDKKKLIKGIFDLDASSVIAKNSCNQEFQGVFTRKTIDFRSCQFEYEVNVKWEFLKQDDEDYTFELTFKILRPEIYVEPVLYVNCSVEIPPLKLYGNPANQEVDVSIEDYRDKHGVGHIIRKIKVRDHCGIFVHLEQIIEFSVGYQAYIEGNLLPSCSENTTYMLNIAGGTAPYNVEWETSEFCKIKTISESEVSIYFTAPVTKISALITDADGCKVKCEATVICAEVQKRASEESNNESDTEFKVIAKPNPFVDVVQITSNRKDRNKYEYIIYNHLGKLQQSGSGEFFENTSFDLDLQILPSGVYYIAITSGKSKDTLKVIKI